jgi:hypothetical protein
MLATLPLPCHPPLRRPIATARRPAGEAEGHRDETLRRALARAEQAERRLRSRLLSRAWPATLGGLAGGFAAVVALRLVGL